jgi:hypothetical protein
MNRPLPPDVLLVKLLRRSDTPTEEDIQRLLSSVELRVAESAMSHLTLPKQSARWGMQERLSGLIDYSRTVLRTYLLLGIASVSRVLIKVRLISSRLLLQ